MKKPCIIGTKNATKILHDGDLVEVDADKGVVEDIRKSKIIWKTLKQKFFQKIQKISMGKILR